MKITKRYNKQELIDIIEKIDISREGNTIITKFNDRIINSTQVSNKYEIFDIVKYLKNKIEIIENNFTINQYSIEIKGGKQTLELMSDKIKVEEIDFHKSFFIINSTDRSRRLSFNSGLKSSDFSMITANAAGLTKKHLKGVTQATEEASTHLNGETFDEQIKSIESLIGHKIKFSKVREVILGNNDDVPKINHKKFDAFKNSVRFSRIFSNLNIDQKNILYKSSDTITSINNNEDFYLDAFWVFRYYLRLFNKQDAHIIKTETERILNITQWAIRNNALEEIGI